MARPRKPLRERIERLSRREGDHLIWHGQMRYDRPHLDRVGNPARILLELENHPDYQIRRNPHDCDEPRCIDPHHYRVIRETPLKYRGENHHPHRTHWRDPRILATTSFTDQELDEIELTVEEITSGKLTLEELKEFPPPDHLLGEILRRTQ